MTRKITRIAIALLIGVIVLGASGAALALAAPAVFNGVQARLEQQARGWWPWAPGMGMGFGRGGVIGTVASVNANGFTVTVTGNTASDTKTITVTVTSQTKFYLMPGMSAAAFSDVKAGGNVRVQGQADSSGVITAQSIVIEPAGEMVAGRVTAVNGQTIMVTTFSGRWGNSQGATSTPVTTTVTIATDSNTKFIQSGGQAATLADVKTGGSVQAWGQKQADGSLLATEVVVGGAGRMGPFPGTGPHPLAPAGPHGRWHA
jgi:hypothetical protein